MESSERRLPRCLKGKEKRLVVRGANLGSGEFFLERRWRHKQSLRKGAPGGVERDDPPKRERDSWRKRGVQDGAQAKETRASFFQHQ